MPNDTSALYDHADPRFLLGGFNRCFCDYGLTDLTIQPKREHYSDADVHLIPSGATGEIKLDVTDDVRTADSRYGGSLDPVAVDALQMTELTEDDSEPNFAIRMVGYYHPDPPWSLNLDPGNYITCEGDLSVFSLPVFFLSFSIF